MNLLEFIGLVLIALVCYCVPLQIEEPSKTQKSRDVKQPSKTVHTKEISKEDDLYLPEDFDIKDLINSSRGENHNDTGK